MGPRLISVVLFPGRGFFALLLKLQWVHGLSPWCYWALLIMPVILRGKLADFPLNEKIPH